MAPPAGVSSFFVARCGISPGRSVSGVVHPGHLRHGVGGETRRLEGLDGPARGGPTPCGESSGRSGEGSGIYRSAGVSALSWAATVVA